MVTIHKPGITAEQAKSFNRYSVANAHQVESRLDCGCQPYRDVYTYIRWQAQGYQVMRGQKAIKLPVIKEQENEDGEVKRRFWKAAVFCWHQVKEIGKPEQPAAAMPSPKVTKVEEPDIMRNWRLI